MPQPFLKIAEGQDVAPEESNGVDCMNMSRCQEHDGKEP